jgi:hypothetical protein
MMRLAGIGLIAVTAHLSAAQAAQPMLPGDHDANAQLTKLVETTRESGLPIDPIVAKVQYAVLVTHADPARIVASARAIAARLAIARDALAPATANDITAGADALGAGANTESLRAVRSASGAHPVATPLGVLAQLLASNVPLKRATELVTTFLRRGASPEQLVAFGNNVNDDVRQGAAVLAAVDTRARFLFGVLAPGASPAAAAVAPGITSGSVPKKP